jgi:hypothetical protein
MQPAGGECVGCFSDLADALLPANHHVVRPDLEREQVAVLDTQCATHLDGNGDLAL